VQARLQTHEMQCVLSTSAVKRPPATLPTFSPIVRSEGGEEAF
jgi:hypothetical protein